MFNYLRKYNLERYQCSNIECKIYFWSPLNETLCGECNPYHKKYYEDTYVKQHFSVYSIRENFFNYFKERNYIIVPERSVKISRHNMNYVMAGICTYVPLYTEGIINHGCNKFVNAQTCIRFKDVELVGRTMRHLTNFVMLGQHIFENDEHTFKSTWKEDAFEQLLEFIKYYIKDLNLIRIHESTWTDNICRGTSLEIFINNIEVFNQVYTTERFTGETLKYKYLDMGAGELRFWQIVNKKSSCYDYFENPQRVILYDHLKTLAKMYNSGIYISKKNVGHNLKKMLDRLMTNYSKEELLEELTKSDYMFLREPYKSFLIESINKHEGLRG
jgi:alanyl-tRNA synthetase